MGTECEKVQQINILYLDYSLPSITLATVSFHQSNREKKAKVDGKAD